MIQFLHENGGWIMKNIEEIKKQIVDENVTILYLNYIDLQGQVRTKGIFTCELLKNLEGFFKDGISVTGSLIDEYQEKSDFFIVRPIPDTFTVINWQTNEGEKSAYVLCDILNNSIDSREIVKKITAQLKEQHLKPMSGLGITYKISNLVETENGGGFYKCFPGSELDSFNSCLASTLLHSGIELEYFVPSGSIHNHLAFVTKDLLKSMDNNALGKWITASYAMSKRKQLVFSKPFENSAPIHLSVWDEQEKRNLFYDPTAEYELSEQGYAFIAGVLTYFDELLAIIAATSGALPKVDYKKKYSYEDDDSIISAPCYFFENGKMARSGWSKRCIFRGIDSEANLYIVTACIFAAGFQGIKASYSLEECVDINYGVNSSLLQEKMEKLQQCQLFNELLGNSIMKELGKSLERIIKEEAEQ